LLLTDSCLCMRSLGRIQGALDGLGQGVRHVPRQPTSLVNIDRSQLGRGCSDDAGNGAGHGRRSPTCRHYGGCVRCPAWLAAYRLAGRTRHVSSRHGPLKGQVVRQHKAACPRCTPLPGRERERKKKRERARERQRERGSARARERESERARERERARETLLGSNVHSGGSWARSGDRYCNRRMNDLCTGTRCAPFLRTGTLKLLLPTVAPSSSKMKSHFKKSVEG